MPELSSVQKLSHHLDLRKNSWLIHCMPLQLSLLRLAYDPVPNPKSVNRLVATVVHTAPLITLPTGTIGVDFANFVQR